MKGFWLVFVVAMLAVSVGGSAAERASVVADGAHLLRVASGFSFTEGPAVDAAGNVFFTDQPNDRIMKWSIDGTLSVFLSPCGRSNGLYFDRDGNLWACADERNELWRIDPQGNVTVVIVDYQGRLLNGPNDLWITRAGGIYFTDPFFQRSYWNRGPMEQSGQHVFYLTPDHQTLRPVVTDMQQPNGIIGTPDGRFLYVADYGGGRTYRYTIQPDGTLGEKTFFCGQGSDGMTLDQEGNLYLTGNGVAVYNRSGQRIQTISVPEGTANVTFGGKDGKTLFVTARSSLYALEMRVQGAWLPPEFNGDGCVNFADFARLAQSWSLDDPNVDLGPTTLGDGIVDARDLSLLAGGWLGEVLPADLKACWKLDEAAGKTAYDSSGRFDATVAGDPLWLPDGGAANGALFLDGVDDFAGTPFVLDPGEGAFSVFAWVKGEMPGQVILSQDDAADWLATDPAEGRLLTDVAPPEGRASRPPLIAEAVVTDGCWHRVGLVWDGLDRILYVDGVEAAREPLLHDLEASREGLQLGAGKGREPGSFWLGRIDDVRLYDRAIVP